MRSVSDYYLVARIAVGKKRGARRLPKGVKTVLALLISSQLMFFAFVVGFDTWVHHFEPQWWNHCQYYHACVTAWQLWALIKVTQHLVTTLRVSVVIRVTLQLNQEQVGQQEVTVP